MCVKILIQNKLTQVFRDREERAQMNVKTMCSTYTDLRSVLLLCVSSEQSI